jgi:hypothetical protein
MTVEIAENTTKLELLLEPYYDEYFEPINWELGKKAKNWIAKIKKGKKSIFDRTFLNSSKLDERIVYRQGNFPEGEIIEQKSVYVKGAKQETLFHGLFIIHHKEDGIYGERISQKDALQYFDCCELLPEVEESQKNKLRVKISTVIRKLAMKYGDQIIAEILTDVLADYLP